MNGAESRLAALKPLLADIHRRLELGFGFRLWDGSTVPAGWPADALALAFADEGAIAGLIKAPNVTTLANLWAAGRIDLKNGTLFDLVARRPKGRTRDLRKSLASLQDRARAGAVSVRAARRPMAARAYRTRPRKRRIGGREQAQHRPSLRRLQCVLRALAGPRTWSTPAPISTTGATTSTRPNGRSSTWSAASFGSSRARRCSTSAAAGARSPATRPSIMARRVVGVTLSERADRASRARRPSALGLADRVTFETRDYALLEGEARFDKISSVGMFETSASGTSRPTFASVQRLLKPGGLYLHHAITRPGRQPCRAHGQEAAGIPGADALHLPRRRTRLSRPHHHQSRAQRLRDPRRRMLAGALPADHPPLARSPESPLRRGGRGGRGNDGARLARLSRRLLDHLRAQQRRRLPDAGDEAGAGPKRPAADAGRTGIDRPPPL